MDDQDIIIQEQIILVQNLQGNNEAPVENLVIDTPSVPTGGQPYVDRLRRYLTDTPETNLLTEVMESTDIELYEALEDCMNEISFTAPIFLPPYTSFTQVPWFLLMQGGVLQILTRKGILSARNTLTYRDSGGVTVQDLDKYGRYQNYFNLLVNKYMTAVKGFKISQNIESCYGGTPSQYALQ